MKKTNTTRKLILTLLGLFLLFVAKAQVGQIIWQENFDTFNSDLWNKISGNGCNQAIGCGWGNNELEYYHGDNVTIEQIPGEAGNNAIVFQAKKEIMGSNQFTSGKISSENKLAIKYGLIEVRMKVPNVETGLWPALWLLGTNQPAAGWPKCGEMDMMEMGHTSAERARQGFSGVSANNYVSANLLWYSPDACSTQNPTCAGSIAQDVYYNKPYTSTTALSNRFLIYRLYWDDKTIRYTVEDNGVEYDFYTGAFPIGTNESAFKKPFYLLLNLAVGGSFTDAATSTQVTAALPAKMYVDYIRVRKWNGKGEVSTSNQIIANAGANQKVNDGKAIILDATGSYGDISTYVWSKNGSQIATGKNATISLLSGTHFITLTVTDSKGNTATDQVSIQVGSELIGEVIWEENFDSFNADIWNMVTGNGCDGESGCGFGNQELQSYNEKNISIEAITEETGNNALVLQAKRETIGNSQFTSGKINTENKLAIKYGVIEIRMKTPDIETGLWPAAWLLGTNYNSVGWPRCGEIDMMEMGHKAVERARLGHAGVSANNYVGANLLWYTSAACGGDNPTCAASIAYDAYYNKPYTPTSGLNNRFVVYRMYWDEASIRFTVVDNGTEHDLYAGKFPIGTNESAFQQPFYLLLNLAVGGNFTDAATSSKVTAPLPAKMYIDYISVKKWNGKGEVSYKAGNILANAGIDQTKTDINRDGIEVVTLNASGSYGNISSYVWTESGVQLAKGMKPQVTLPTGAHYITLTATDNNGKTSTDDIFVDVREIIWEDNFNLLDTALWKITTGNGCNLPSGCGFGNQELQYYHENNVTIAPISGEAGNNALVLQAKKESVNNSLFTSGKITSQDNVAIRYGLIEVRMKSPNVETGLWPAAWLLGINQPTVGWPKCGEIDMMEMGHKATERTRQGFPNISPNNYVGANLLWYSSTACSTDNPICAASIAYDVYYDKPYVANTGLNNRFLIYRMYWDNKSIRFTVEDNGAENDLYTGAFPIGAEESAFQQPFYFLLNLAVGGNFTDAALASQVTAPLPANMLVDYVRVMKWNGKGEVTFKSGLSANAGQDATIIIKDKNAIPPAYLDGSGSTDVNGTITNYSWKENDIEIATGVMPEIMLAKGKHIITLTVTDNAGNIATDMVNVTVTTGGASPIADAGDDATINDDDGDDLVEVTLDGSGSSDPNDALLNYSWTENGNEIAKGVNQTVSLKTGTHKITLTISNEDELTSTDEVLITVIDPDNLPPIANAGNDQMLTDDDGNDNVAATLDGSGCSDSDGTIDNYLWIVDGVKIAKGVTSVVDFATGKHIITLEITDNDGIKSSDEITIDVVDPDNLPPIANAGTDSTIIDSDRNGSQPYTLNGTGSMDSDGTIVNFSWIENGSEIAQGKTSTINFTSGEHIITLVVTDNDGIVSSDQLIIKVNQLPIAKAGIDIFVKDNDGDGSELVTLNGSESSDPFGTIVNYSWQENASEIASGETTTYNFTKGTHIITLLVTDNDGFAVSDEISVVVANANNTAPIANAGSDALIVDVDNNGNEPFTLDATNSLDTDGSIISYQWLENSMEIASGKTKVVDLAAGIHTIILKVTDNEGATASDTVKITIKQGICNLDACTKDYTARVISTDAANTTIKFIPAKIGIGDKLCLLYFGTNPNSAFPASTVTPYQSFKIPNVTAGQKVYFYYTYSLPAGGEQNTGGCKHTFVVGDCVAQPNKAPVANAGADFTFKSPVGSTTASVTLDGSGSTDSDGSISNYVWTEGSKQIATGEKPTVSLTTGSHTIYLIVTDNTGDPTRDKVIVSIEIATEIVDILNTGDLQLYPIPVTNILNVTTNQGNIERILVYNAYGIKVLEETGATQIDMSILRGGFYIVAAVIDGKSIVRKVVKI